MKYNEEFRPLLHITPRAGFLNDPNGLFFDEETHTYHVCFQYQKDVHGDSRIGWRHTSGKDLYDLKELDTIICPNDYGVIFSGCSVRGTFAKIMSFYTVHNLNTKHEYQAMSFSHDGIKWIPYREGAPLIDNEGDRYGINAFRDPKVVRLTDGQWLMIVGGGVLRLFASQNLLDWEYQSSVKNVPAEDGCIERDMLVLQKYLPLNDPHDAMMISECPDLFSMKDETGTEKWVLSGGGMFYVIGKLVKEREKYRFIPESKKRKFVWSSDFFAHRGEPYAMQTFSDGRRIAFFWHMDTSAEVLSGKPWNGALSLPLELTLRGDRLYAYPVDETEQCFTHTVFSADTLNDDCVLEESLLRCFMLQVSMKGTADILLKNDSSVIRLRYCEAEGKFYVDRTRADMFSANSVEEIPCESGQICLIKDGCILDIFTDCGRCWYSTFIISENTNYTIEVKKCGNMFLKDIRLRSRVPRE